MFAHFSETDLLEIHYLEREAEPEVAAHLGRCERCSAQLGSVRDSLRLAAAVPVPDDAFFERQRRDVMRRVGERPPAARPWRYAAAAMLVLAIGGVAVQRSADHAAPPQTATHAATTASAAIPTTDTTVPRDVWDTDELNDFQPLVDWQSWEETKGTNGGRS